MLHIFVTFVYRLKTVSKPKKHILTLDQDQTFDFDLFGICSHHNDYRLAWGMNEKLGIRLEKSDEDYVVMKKGVLQSSHSKYYYKDPENRAELFLLRNKSLGKFLVPEKPTIDYFLFICENHFYEPEQVLTALRDVSSILGAYVFDPAELDSAENIVLI